jgi:hypothetical protein
VNFKNKPKREERSSLPGQIKAADYERKNRKARKKPLHERVKLTSDLVENRVPPPPDRITKLLPARGKVMIVGQPAGGKTFGALEMARAISEGGFAFGIWPARMGKCMIIEEEHEKEYYDERLYKSDAYNPNFLSLHRDDFRLDNPEEDDVNELISFINENAIVCCILDPLVDLFEDKDESRADEIGIVIRATKKLAKECAQTVFIYVHHTTKSAWPGDEQREPSLADVRGSGRIASSMDVVYNFRPVHIKEDEYVAIELTALRGKDGPTVRRRALTLYYSEPQFEWVDGWPEEVEAEEARKKNKSRKGGKDAKKDTSHEGVRKRMANPDVSAEAPEVQIAHARNRVMDFMRKEGEVASMNALVSQIGGKKATTRKAIEALIKEGRLYEAELTPGKNRTIFYNAENDVGQIRSDRKSTTDGKKKSSR